MWTSMQYRRVVLGSAWYDLIVSAALVTPWSFAALHGVLMSMTQLFDLPGELPPFAPAHVLMVNLLGSIVCVWAVLRIRDPQALYGRYDAVGRFCLQPGCCMRCCMGPVRCCGFSCFRGGVGRHADTARPWRGACSRWAL